MAALTWKKGYPYIVKWVDGKKKWMSLSVFADLGRLITTKKEAAYWFKVWRDREDEADLPSRSSDNQLSSLFRAYLRDGTTSKSAATQKSDYSRVRILEQYFAENEIKSLRAITPQVVEQFKRWKRRSCGPTTVNRYLEILRHWLNIQVRDDLIPKNPMAKVKMLPVIGRRQIRALSEKEIKVIEQQFPAPYREFCMLGYLAGLRRAEIVNLEWADIDFRHETITIQAKDGFGPKGRDPETIPLAPKLKSILAAVERRGRYIFDNGDDRPLCYPEVWYRRIVRELYKLHGIDGANIHTLRHTFCTRLVRAGVSLPLVQKLARHKDYSTTLQYAHLDQNDLKNALAMLPK